MENARLRAEMAERKATTATTITQANAGERLSVKIAQIHAEVVELQSVKAALRAQAQPRGDAGGDIGGRQHSASIQTSPSGPARDLQEAANATLCWEVPSYGGTSPTGETLTGVQIYSTE